MASKKRLAPILLSALLVLPGVVFAQGPGGGGGGAPQGGGGGGQTRSAPSTSGGSVGGPGMSGAAVNTGSGGTQAGGGSGPQAGGGGGPQAGGGSGPQAGGGGGPQAGGGGGPQAGGGGGPQAGGGGGPQAGGGGGPQAGGGGGPQAGGGGGPQAGGGGGPRAGGGSGPLAGGDQPAFSPDAFSESMAAFAARGSGNLSLDSFFSESGFTGFQDLADQTFESVFGAGQGQQAAADASAQAQGAYDQLWTDYYAAVDSTAQTYYDTVTASTDYALQAYEEAVDYTAQTVDDYAGNYADYAAYCATYSWDCYSYSYDSTTDSYTYTGETSSTAGTTITIGDINTTINYPADSEPVPSADAYEALVVFANDQLAVTVDPLYAGSFTGDVQTIMAYLPAEIQAMLLNATSISGSAYWGLMAGGAGVVLVGDCASSPSACTVNGDNLTTQISSASAGAYGFLVSAAAPTTADSALQLVTQVYPKFTGLSFAQVTDVETGYLFMATTASMGIDPATNQPISVAKVIYGGVVTVNGQSFVYTLVGIGEGYVNVLN